MPNRNDCWGIEVGANAIKAIRLVRKKTEIIVADYEVLPFKKILTTPDINVDEAIQVNLDQFLSQHLVSKSTVIISVPGHMAFARFVPLPPVDPKKIPDIVRFETVQQVPFPIEQVEWDYQIFSRADSPDVEVGIVAMTKERIAQYLSNYFAVGLSVDGLTVSHMAVYNALAYDMELTPESPGTIMVDIGTTATDLIVVDNGSVWIRTLPIGGNNFTEALVRAFKLSFPKAERLKREAGTSKYARQIFQAMRPVFADLVQEMQRSLGYYQSLHRDAKLTRLIGVGSTFRLPGMQKFLKQQLQVEVIRPDGFKRVKIDGKEESGFAESAMNLATAYGLALQGLELEKVSINVLPNNLIRQRIWRDKSIWFGAAAGLMVGAIGIVGGKLWLTESIYQRAYNDRKDVVSAIEKSASDLNAAMLTTSAKADPRNQIDNIRGVLDYRDVWPKLIEDLDLATKALDPQHDLDDSNYAAISSIPPTDRRKLYISSFSAVYHFDAMPEPKPVAPAVQPGPGAASAQAVAPASPAAKPGSTHAGPTFAKWSGPSPYYVITLRGTTPYAKGNELVGTTFVKWLQDNAVRPDRPYRIIVDPAKIKCDQVTDTSYGGALAPLAPLAPPTPAPTENPAPDQNDNERRNPTPGGGDASSDNPPADNATPEPAIAPPPVAVAPLPGTTTLYPLRPLLNEPKDGDWTFEISWQVQLLKPEDVGRVEANDDVTTSPASTVIPTAAPAGRSTPPARPLPLSSPQQGKGVAP